MAGSAAGCRVRATGFPPGQSRAAFWSPSAFGATAPAGRPSGGAGEDELERRLAERIVERGHDAGVELRAGAAVHFGERLGARDLCAVDAVGRHRVVGVGNEEDARGQLDLLAGEVVRVARAVPALVVVQHPGGYRVEVQRLEHPVADLRVA